ncbi:MAG: hypothetical protein AVDCRST_MAG04-1641 [uncultured Acetobacteraceae bacterium]|uniref:Antitoxin n=1 Tax=uncultured Acetobacteraceae bacterium TaxID=169975 RepID=A0A6J4I3E4_9PROT|nr:MAG: hypothetical protein AVDCRST_MAG04-1641 [uncultured Acetobacteraceae bacterium]
MVETTSRKPCRARDPSLRGQDAPAPDPRRCGARETVVITRHGRPIARLVPEASRRQAEIDEAVESIMRLRAGRGTVTAEEILSSIREGRKY